MPDRHTPPRWRLLLRILRGGLYLAVMAMGAAGLIWTPQTIVGTIGEPLTYWWTGLSAGGAFVALLGIVIDRYRLEWVAVWPAAGGTLAYAVTVWGIVSAEQPTRAAQAFAITALFMALTYRGATLAADAARLRAEHHGRS